VNVIVAIAKGKLRLPHSLNEILLLVSIAAFGKKLVTNIPEREISEFQRTKLLSIENVMTKTQSW
jgi:hypothetical protein